MDNRPTPAHAPDSAPSQSPGLDPARTSAPPPPVEALTGAALAEAVAVEVMGWRPVWMLTCPRSGSFISGHFDSAAECEAFWKDSPSFAWRLADGWKAVAHWRIPSGGTCGDTSDNWRPDRDIAAAWQVVEWLRALGWAYVFSDVGSGHDACYWREPDGLRSRQSVWATATELPTAISRAALKAIRGQTGGAR